MLSTEKLPAEIMIILNRTEKQIQPALPQEKMITVTMRMNIQKIILELINQKTVCGMENTGRIQDFRLAFM